MKYKVTHLVSIIQEITQHIESNNPKNAELVATNKIKDDFHSSFNKNEKMEIELIKVEENGF
jgi:hypothetical protein